MILNKINSLYINLPIDKKIIKRKAFFETRYLFWIIEPIKIKLMVIRIIIVQVTISSPAPYVTGSLRMSSFTSNISEENQLNLFATQPQHQY